MNMHLVAPERPRCRDDMIDASRGLETSPQTGEMLIVSFSNPKVIPCN